MKIIIDAMGGDNAPQAPVLGTLKAREQLGVDVCLVGRITDMLGVLKEAGIGDLPQGVELRDAPEVVEMCDDPAKVVRTKKESSMVVGLNMLTEGYGDAFASAGSTGALLTAATLVAKRVRGIRRAALGSLIPTAKGKALLIDCGANLECTPEYLLQFAYMGSYYMDRMMDVKNPTVGILNIGAEPTKGRDLQVETYKVLEAEKAAGRLNFVGNVESREVMSGDCDIIVCDGYSGNILLKGIEGVGVFFKNALKDIFYKSLRTKLGALMVKDGIDDLKNMMDYNSVGGAPLLGISLPVYKIHGSAGEQAVTSAIGGVKKYVESGIIEEIAKNIEYMRLEPAPGK